MSQNIKKDLRNCKNKVPNKKLNCRNKIVNKKKKCYQNYFKKSEIILHNLEKEHCFEVKTLPKYIMKYHIANCKKIDKASSKKMDKASNKFKYVYDNVYTVPIDIVTVEELQCVSLNTTYDRCRGRVKYIHENVNHPGENFNYKKNLPFCDKHIKEIMKNSNNLSLKNGYYYESDLYDRQIYKPFNIKN